MFVCVCLSEMLKVLKLQEHKVKISPNLVNLTQCDQGTENVFSSSVSSLFCFIVFAILTFCKLCFQV